MREESIAIDGCVGESRERGIGCEGGRVGWSRKHRVRLSGSGNVSVNWDERGSVDWSMTTGFEANDEVVLVIKGCQARNLESIKRA